MPPLIWLYSNSAPKTGAISWPREEMRPGGKPSSQYQRPFENLSGYCKISLRRLNTLLVITDLCVSRCCEILFELFVKHFHHTRILHAVHNLVGSFLSFLLTHILSFDDLRRSEVAFSCQPCEYSLVELVTPVVKGVGHFCVRAAESRPCQLQEKLKPIPKAKPSKKECFSFLGTAAFVVI